MSTKAIVLLSGGLDSATCLAFARAQGFYCYTLSFDYGQKHQAELIAAANIAAHYCAEHRVFRLPINDFGGSALTDDAMLVPNYQPGKHIPTTYVPARNTIFLSIALGLAEVLGVNDLFIGVSAIDFSNYPDCRLEYIRQFEQLANIATKAGVEGKRFTIHTPLINLSKAQTIQLGLDHGVDYQKTISCYRSDTQGRACGNCDSCTFRKQGFSELGVNDPTCYQP